jgi:Tfp pilus assembly protein PilF
MRELGPDGEKHYPIVHVMGGKNVYYFLTPLKRGRLQVLPLAYDVHKKHWYDVAASGVRHFPDRRDEALPWTDRLYTFNTTCFNCHVSELATRYDLATDTYHTSWGEAGISCEACHGPAGEHVRVMEAGEKGRTSKEIKIIRAKEFTHEQMNDMCATCHAKMIPLSTNFVPGDKFFDHYDLITWEHPDFYPDGRDLGENYTFTSWEASPCLKSGEFDCNHCHTPSGRLRFEGDKSNQMCLPCHENYVAHPVEHGHHLAGSKGNECVACHMPMTRFAAMGRTDHSMRSPMPAATMAFTSPNACNLCHTDHDAAWSDEWVRKWYPRDYQAEPLRQARLLDEARKGQWGRLPEMLAEITKKDNNLVYRNSLVRTLAGCDDPRKWPALIRALKDPSPLVRGSAASALQGRMTRESVEALLAAASDESRLVRIRAAVALAAIPPETLKAPAHARALKKADAEFAAAMRARPDDWASYANLGNFALEQQDLEQAVKLFEDAYRLEPRMVGPMTNAAIAYSRLGRSAQAEDSLRRALAAEPANAAVNFNLGLLLAENGKLGEAEKALRIALKSDPQMAAAAYNLGVILANRNETNEALTWCRKAHELRPEDSKYAYTLAFYLQKKGNSAEAVRVLKDTSLRQPLDFEAGSLLADIYEQQGNHRAAADVYRDLLARPGLPDAARRQFEAKLEQLAPKP